MGRSGQNLFNDVKLNASWNGQRIPPAGDALAARHLRVPVPAGVRARPLRRRHSRRVVLRHRRAGGDHRAVGSRCCRRPPTSRREQADVDQERSTRCGPASMVTRNRKDQNGRFAHTGAVNFNPTGNPNIDRLRVRRRAARQLPHLLRRAATTRSGSSASRSTARFVSDTWRVRDEPEPRDRAAVRVPAADLHAGQQHREFRSGAVRRGGRPSVLNRERHDRRRSAAIGTPGWFAPAAASPRISRTASRSTRRPAR